MPLTPTSRRCGLPKKDGTPCRRGIAEGLYTCAAHNDTPEGQAFNRKKRREAMLADDRRHDRKILAERVEKAALKWFNAGIYRRDNDGGLLDAVCALHQHDTGETHQQAASRWDREKKESA